MSLLGRPVMIYPYDPPGCLTELWRRFWGWVWRWLRWLIWLSMLALAFGAGYLVGNQ